MVNKWELKGKIIASSYRKRMLLKLNEGIFTPRELEKSLNIKMSHISKTLTELQKLKLIECLTPTLRKGKQYKITKLGKEVLKLL
jgi:predicted transcriptional regulator